VRAFCAGLPGLNAQQLDLSLHAPRRKCRLVNSGSVVTTNRLLLSAQHPPRYGSATDTSVEPVPVSSGIASDIRRHAERSRRTRHRALRLGRHAALNFRDTCTSSSDALGAKMFRINNQSSEGFADPVVGEGGALDGRLDFRHVAGCTVLRVYGAGRTWVISCCFCSWLIDVTLQTA